MCVWSVVVEGKWVVGVWWYVGFHTIAHQWCVYVCMYVPEHVNDDFTQSFKSNCLLSKTFMFEFALSPLLFMSWCV